MTAISRYTRTTVLPAIIAAIVAFLVALSPAEAQTSATWTGGAGNGTWSIASNWSTLPTTAGTWNLFFGGTNQTTTTNNIGTINLSGLSFTNNGSAGQTATFTLSGSTLAFSNATITTTATSGGSLGASGDVIANALSITGSNTVTLGAGHNMSLTTGGISGSGSLTYGVSGGNATVFLSGSNSYSGGTYVTGGQIRTAVNGVADGSNNNAFGTGNVIVSGSGSVALRNGTTLANNFTIGGMGLSSSGTQGAIRGSFSTSSRTATVSGSVTLSADATIVTAATAGLTDSRLVLSGPVDLGSNVLTLAPDLAITNSTSVPIVISGSIGGTGSIVVAGNTQSTALLSAANSYSGGTTLTSGTLAVGNGSALGTGALAADSGTLDLNGQSLSVGTLSSGSSAVIRSSVAGAASLRTTSEFSSSLFGSIADGVGVVSLTKAGGGTIYNSGSNSYSGDTDVTGGQIRTGADGVADGFNNNAFGTGHVIVSGSGSVALRNGTTLANNFTIGGMGLSSSGTQGAIRGSFSTSSRTATISGSMTLSADATIVTAATAGITDSRLVLSGPMNLGSYTLTFKPAIASGLARFSDSTAVPIVVTGTMFGSGDVIVAGESAVYMNGVSSSLGATIVRSGALGGNGSIAGVVTVENGATLAPGSAANTTGALSVGGLQFNSGATAEMMISGTGIGLYDQVVALNNVAFGGTLAIDFTQNGFANGTVWQLFSGASFSGSFASVTMVGSYGSPSFSNVGGGEWKADLGGGQSLVFYENDSHAFRGQFTAGQLVIVPEPSAIFLTGIGVCYIGWRNWKRVRTARRLWFGNT
jgi:fibronectin-binding autotransporter adhesin